MMIVLKDKNNNMYALRKYDDFQKEYNGNPDSMLNDSFCKKINDDLYICARVLGIEFMLLEDILKEGNYTKITDSIIMKKILPRLKLHLSEIYRSSNKSFSNRRLNIIYKGVIYEITTSGIYTINHNFSIIVSNTPNRLFILGLLELYKDLPGDIALKKISKLVNIYNIKDDKYALYNFQNNQLSFLEVDDEFNNCL